MLFDMNEKGLSKTKYFDMLWKENRFSELIIEGLKKKKIIL